MAHIEKVSEKKDIHSKRLQKERDVKFGLFESNKAQGQAVEYEKCPLIIVAGPDTGKTRTLTERIAHLVTYKGDNRKGRGDIFTFYYQ